MTEQDANQANKKSHILLISIPVVLLVLAISLVGIVKAAGGTLNVSPTTGLSNGQKITVSGSGFAKKSTGTVTECNGASNQPTVTIAGNQVPVGCVNPLSSLVTTDANGNLPSTSYTVKTGTIGPAATGKDSAGNDAATDAAKYPCPPTAAQVSAGVSCNITFGDAGGDDISKNISFTTKSTSPSSSNSTSTGTSSTGNTGAGTGSSSTGSSSNLVNTGPGDVIGLFVGAVIVGTLGHEYYTRRSGHKI